VALKELFTHNIGWKIGGIILALMLWFHLTTEKHYEGDYTAKIEYTGLADDLYVEKIEPPKVEIKIIATGKQLAYLDLINRPRIRIDLSSVESAGTYKYNITLLEIYNIDPYEYSSVDFPSNGRCNVVVKRRS
jgi:YbbR domain-containing protein